MYFHYLLYYKVRCVYVCLFVCGHSDVRLTTPPVLMLWGTQGYLWFPYDLTEVINLIGERLEPKKYFFQKNTLSHSFRTTVIPSGLLSFLPNIVIPSELFRELQILLAPKASHTRRARKMATGGGHICEYIIICMYYIF